MANKTESEAIDWRGVIDALRPGDGFRLKWKENGNPNLRIEFPNNWGASLIWDGPGQMQPWPELAVSEGLDGSLNYETSVTDDVIPYLDRKTLVSLLDDIRALPTRYVPEEN